MILDWWTYFLFRLEFCLKNLLLLLKVSESVLFLSSEAFVLSCWLVSRMSEARRRSLRDVDAAEQGNAKVSYHL